MKQRSTWRHASRMGAIAVLFGVLLSACSGGTVDTGGSEGGTSLSSSPAAPPRAAAPIAIEATRVAGGGESMPAPEDDVIKLTIDEKLGTDLKMTLFSSTDEYYNQLNIRMAADNPPDLISLNRDRLKEFARAGLLLDLTPYIDKLNNVPALVGGDKPYLKATVDNKIVGVPKISGGTPGGTFWIRKDWLDRVGLPVPATLDELHAAAKAFTENDPDGNGKQDTYGFTGIGNMSAFPPIFGAFGTGQPGDFYLKDGTLVNSFYDPATKAALDYIRTLMDEGLVEPDFMANTSAPKAAEKAYQGKVGIIYTHWANITKEQFRQQIKAVNPEAEWVQVPAVTGPGGTYNTTIDLGADGGFYGLPKKLEKTPEKLDKVLELLNYVATEEGAALVQYGLEGKHYNVSGDKIVPTPLMDSEGAYFLMYQFLGRVEPGYLYAKFPADAEHIDFAAAQPQLETLNGYIDKPEGYNHADAMRYAQEEIVKFVYGKRSFDEYDAFVQTLETTFQYKKYTDQAQVQLKELGLLK